MEINLWAGKGAKIGALRHNGLIPHQDHIKLCTNSFTKLWDYDWESVGLKLYANKKEKKYIFTIKKLVKS